MAFGRKRIYANAFRTVKRTPFKRRRIVRRNRFRRGNKSVQYSDQRGIAATWRFKSRRLRPRAFRSLLWKDTIASTHYRTNGSALGSLVTPAGAITMTLGRAQAFDNGVAPFWQATGGALSKDPGIAVPVFKGNIVIRGGIVGIRIHNLPTAVMDINVSVYLIRNAPRPSYTNLPAVAPIGWEPTLTSEFNQDIGSIKYSRRFTLSPGGTMNLERRLPIQKIDLESWAVDASRWEWLIGISDTDGAGFTTVQIVTYFNASFSGDAAV